MWVLHVKKAFRTLGIFWFVIAASGCSGSNGEFIGAQTSIPTTATTQVNVPTSGIRQILPTIAGITPTIEVPGGDVTQAFALTVGESTAAPAGFHALNGTTPSLYITIVQHGGPAQLPVAPVLTFALASGTSNNTLATFFVPDGTTGTFARRAAIARPADSTTQSTLVQNAQIVSGDFAYQFPFGDYSGTIALEASQTNPQPGCALAEFAEFPVSLCAGPFSATGSSFSGPIVVGFTGFNLTGAPAANQGCAPGFQTASIPATRVAAGTGDQIDSTVSGSFGAYKDAFCNAAISDGSLWYTFNVDLVQGGGNPGALTVVQHSTSLYLGNGSILVEEDNYAGPILYSPTLSTCSWADEQVTAQVGSVGSYLPTSDRGPYASFYATHTGNAPTGSCNLAFVDDHQGVAMVPVNFLSPPPSPSPSPTSSSPPAGTLTANSSPFIVTSLAITYLTISESAYSGPITIDAATTCVNGSGPGDDFSISPLTGTGPSQIFAFDQTSASPPHFTPSPSGPFNYCNMVFDDNHGGQLTVQTTVEP